MRKRKAFTMIELMITMVIIVILVVVSVPGYFRVMLKIEEKKAMATLYDYYRASKAYFIDHQTYAPAQSDLDSYEDLPFNDEDWQYVYAGGGNTFTVDAFHQAASGGADGIALQIDETGSITRVNWPW